MSDPIKWNALTEAERCALVAEKVMGKEVYLVHSYESPVHSWKGSFSKPHFVFFGDEKEYYLEVADKRGSEDRWRWEWKHIPNPLRSIADAWEVVEAVTGGIVWVSLEGPTPDDDVATGWRCSIMHWIDEAGDDRHAYADAATPQEAIVLAALRAKGLEIVT